MLIRFTNMSPKAFTKQTHPLLLILACTLRLIFKLLGALSFLFKFNVNDLRSLSRFIRPRSCQSRLSSRQADSGLGANIGRLSAQVHGDDWLYSNQQRRRFHQVCLIIVPRVVDWQGRGHHSRIRARHYCHWHWNDSKRRLATYNHEREPVKDLITAPTDHE